MDLEPTIHEGYAARKIASEGFISPVIEYNKGVTERNNKLKEIWREKGFLHISGFTQSKLQQMRCHDTVYFVYFSGSGYMVSVILLAIRLSSDC